MSIKSNKQNKNVRKFDSIENLIGRKIFFDSNIDWIKRYNGLTNHELGEFFGVDKSQVTHYTQGKGFPKLIGLINCSIEFNYSLEDLIFKDLSKQEDSLSNLEEPYSSDGIDMSIDNSKISILMQKHKEGTITELELKDLLALILVEWRKSNAVQSDILVVQSEILELLKKTEE